MCVFVCETTAGFLPKMLKKVPNVVVQKSEYNLEHLNPDCIHFPGDCREMEVTLIFKNGDGVQSSNYRPISITSIVGKFMESIMVDKITSFLESNVLVWNSKHGFRRH